MIEPARVQAAIEILGQVATSLSEGGASADVLIRKYFRSRRYAGSKDRRYVTDLCYQVIRNWGFLQETATGDLRKMLLLALKEQKKPEEIEILFTGAEHAPDKLSEDEKTFISVDYEKLPHHKLNYPLWLEEKLQARFGDNFATELASLNGRAPFDLRVNLAKSTVAEVEEFLKSENITYEKGKWAATALVLGDNPRIDQWKLYQDGKIEIQDEAAQLAVALSDIRPGQQVMDLCAGAGGKTLAMAAHMDNKGQIYAYDNNARRLKDLKPRAKKANARIVQSCHIDTAGGKRQKMLSEHLGRMDRVVLDVPCSGSGVWRRNPETRWRLTAEKLDQYCRIQKSLLGEGWGFVKEGGRLIYMTCSLFDEENEQQITNFLNNHQDAKLISYRGAYERVSGGAELTTLSSLPECLALSPHTHCTDGFFVAILEKQASPMDN